MTLKMQIHEECLLAIDQKINAVQAVLNELKETGAGETKSTAGDKHETALAMIQIEQENKRNQLRVFLEQKAELLKIDPAVEHYRVSKGSLVKTNRCYLFISIGLGKVSVNNLEVIMLSAQSPLGQKMLGALAGDEIILNEVKYVLEEVA